MQYYTYFNTIENRVEKVTKELWCWEVQYKDGTTLKQFDDTTNSFHRFAEIDQATLHTFFMINQETQQTIVLVFNPEEMKLIHFYQHTILAAGTADEQRIKTYCFGYEKRIHGEVYKHLTLIVGEQIIITDAIERVTIG